MVVLILEGEVFSGGASPGLDEFLVLMQFIYYIAHTLKLTTIFYQSIVYENVQYVLCNQYPMKLT